MVSACDQHQKHDSATKFGHVSTLLYAVARDRSRRATFIFAARHDRLLGVSCPSGGSLLLIVRRSAAHHHPQTTIPGDVSSERVCERSVGAPASGHGSGDVNRDRMAPRHPQSGRDTVSNGRPAPCAHTLAPAGRGRRRVAAAQGSCTCCVTRTAPRALQPRSRGARASTVAGSCGVCTESTHARRPRPHLLLRPSLQPFGQPLGERASRAARRHVPTTYSNV